MDTSLTTQTSDFQNIDNQAGTILSLNSAEADDTASTPYPDAQIIRNFLEIMFGQARPDGQVVLWTKPEKQSTFFPTSDLEGAAHVANFLASSTDVFFGIGLHGAPPAGGGRGTEDGVIALPGLWLDLDVQGPTHKSDKLPPDMASALELIQAFNLAPTLTVSTGGGLHLHWLFDKPLVIEADTDREKVKALSKRFQNYFIKLAEARGWKIDDTSDLSRLLRLPGTLNRKIEPPLAIEMIQEEPDRRYTPEEIEGALDAADRSFLDDQQDIEEGTRNTTLTSIAGILRQQGHGYKEIREKLNEINKARCKPPLEDQEVDEIANSVSRYEPGKVAGEKGQTQAEILIGLTDQMVFFHTPDKDCFAQIPVGTHKEVWSLESKEFKTFLLGSFYKSQGTPPCGTAIQDTLGILRARALFDSDTRQVFTRVAEHDGCIYLDLCDEDWNVVKIGPDGWCVLNDYPVCFRRSKSTQALPTPENGGSITDLFRFINAGEEDRRLITGWIIGGLRPSGPYPILVLQGEQGSAKSTTARILKELIDPSVGCLRSLPSSARDLMVMAKNSWSLAFDNLSGMSHQMSDALCRLSTGGGLSTRGLYTNDDEFIFDSTRSMILNGIEDILTRNDLADRSVIVNLPRIEESQRKLERDLWADFNQAKPKILGAFLDAMSTSIKNFDTVKLTSLPRMADFAKAVVAAEPSLPWAAGEFMKTYDKNRKMSSTACFDGDHFASALKDFIEVNEHWEGTASELLDQLGQFAGSALTNAKGWPKQPNHLAGRVKRLAPSLRIEGIDVEQVIVKGQKRWRFAIQISGVSVVNSSDN